MYVSGRGSWAAMDRYFTHIHKINLKKIGGIFCIDTIFFRKLFYSVTKAAFN
jgi:hypothetical protein